ncbi:MAG: amidohydrolase family protein, partial [bacterium]|nr:amidohydrolase family protein [bacterium]
MKTQPSQVMSQVLMSVGENRVRLVDLYFDEKIARIQPCIDQDIQWDDISDPEKWESFKEEFPASVFPQQIQVHRGDFMLLIPGAIDTHVHFNTPGFEHRETFETGSYAAACGGVTMVVDMPCTSLPPVNSAINFERKSKIVERRSYVDYAFWGGVRGNDFALHKNVNRFIAELSRAGVAGFKVYTISGMRSFHYLNQECLLQTACWVSRTAKPLAIHAEDRLYVRYKQHRYQTKWQNDWRAYCDSRDDIAEARAVARLIYIAQK